jgi:hypothetical protein
MKTFWYFAVALVFLGGVAWLNAERFSTPAGVGVLYGKMTIGPICPVERPGVPCKPTPEQYAAYPVTVYESDKHTLVQTLVPNANGQFSATLPSGNYWIDVPHSGIGRVTGAPMMITIPAAGVATSTIDIDTGIR